MAINIIDMKKYTSSAQILDMCRKVNIPEEAVTKALSYIGSERFLAAAPYFTGLFSRNTAPESIEAIITLNLDENGELIDDGFCAMAVFLAASQKTKEIYEERGISLRIYYETMSFYNEILGENLMFFGKYTFDRLRWYYRQIAGIIHKLGVLEYELKTLRKSDKGNEYEIYGLCENANVLSVHIQTGSVITRKALDESYKMAVEFSKKYYPNIKFEAFVCDSWLLSPTLKELIPNSSKIISFQSDYEIVHHDESNNSFYPYVFNIKDKPKDFNNLPENTSLRRNIKKHLLSGGEIGSGCGIIRI